MEWAPLAVFVVAFAAMSVPALPRVAAPLAARRPRLARALALVLDRPGVAVAGGVAMIAVGAVGPAAAARAVDLGTLELLLGMMLLVAALEVAGFFEVAATALVRTLHTPRRLLVGVMALTALLSALLLNDAVVLLLTPVLVHATRRAGLHPMPFLAGEAVAANVGSVATPIGNPQNAFIAVRAGLTFPEFVTPLAPVAAASLGIAVAVALVAFRRHLPATRFANVAAPPDPDRRLLALGVAGLAVLVGLLVAGRAVPLGLAEKAALVGLAVLALAWPVARASPVRLLRRIDWSILAFFVGLFVLVAGVRESGLLARLHDGLGPAALASAPGLVALAAVLSNVVSNVPATVLLAPAVEAAGDASRWLLLAAATTLAGNATILGAAANVIVAQSARANGADLDAWKFLAYGLPVTIATLAVATWMLG